MDFVDFLQIWLLILAISLCLILLLAVLAKIATVAREGFKGYGIDVKDTDEAIYIEIDTTNFLSSLNDAVRGYLHAGVKRKNEEVEKPKRKNDEQPSVGLWTKEESLPPVWYVGDDGEIEQWTSTH